MPTADAPRENRVNYGFMRRIVGNASAWMLRNPGKTMAAATALGLATGAWTGAGSDHLALEIVYGSVGAASGAGMGAGGLRAASFVDTARSLTDPSMGFLR